MTFANSSQNEVTVEKTGINWAAERVVDGAKIFFDFETIKVGDNIRLGGYTLHEGDTVQLDYTYNGSDIAVSILEFGNAWPLWQTRRTFCQNVR